MAKRTEAEQSADKALLSEATEFSALNDGAPAHVYFVKMASGHKELAYVAEALLKEGKNLLARIRAYHESKDKDGFRRYIGDVAEVVQTIGKATKATKATKAMPVLIAAKSVKAIGGKKK